MRSKEELMRLRGQGLTEEEYLALDERNQAIAKERLSGKSYGEIGKQFNLSRNYIKMLCKKQGVRIVVPQMKKKKKQRRVNLTMPLF